MPVIPTLDDCVTSLPDVEGKTVEWVKSMIKGSGDINSAIIIVGNQVQSDSYIIQSGDTVDIVTFD